MIYLFLLLVCNINIINVFKKFLYLIVDKYGFYLILNVLIRGGFINVIVVLVRFIWMFLWYNLNLIIWM